VVRVSQGGQYLSAHASTRTSFSDIFWLSNIQKTLVGLRVADPLLVGTIL